MLQHAITLSEFIFTFQGGPKNDLLECPSYRIEFVSEFELYDHIEQEIKSGSPAANGYKKQKGFYAHTDQITNKFNQITFRYWVRPIPLIYWLLMQNLLETRYSGSRKAL